MTTRILGIDPGLVHTGVVSIVVDPEIKQFTHVPYVVAGLAVDEIVDIAAAVTPDKVFIEAYRPRSHFDNDARMGAAVNELRQRIPHARALNNTGVKQVVTQELMQLLHLWKFTHRTNHQDLRSAARIALFGMLKDEELNQLLTTIVIDSLDGNPWNIA